MPKTTQEAYASATKKLNAREGKRAFGKPVGQPVEQSDETRLGWLVRLVRNNIEVKIPKSVGTSDVKDDTFRE